jgi:hypothetical protein
LRDPSVPAAAKTIYAVIDEVAGHETITIGRLADWLGMNTKTARKHLHALRDAGWIEVIEVFEPVRGQVASEYVGNAYPFQHVTEATDESALPEPADQDGQPDEPPDSSGQEEGSGSSPSHNNDSTPDDGTGVDESGSPAASQKSAGPSSYRRDDETPPPTSSTTTPSKDGFQEFWAAYPPGPYKGRKADCHRLWQSLTVEERRDAWRALNAYRESQMWADHGAGSPMRWLQNDPWLEYRLGNLPQPRPRPVKYLTPDDIRLPD